MVRSELTPQYTDDSEKVVQVLDILNQGQQVDCLAY